MKNAGLLSARLDPVQFCWWSTRWTSETVTSSCASSQRARRLLVKGEPMKKLTKEQKRDIRAIAKKRDQDIDFSDAPTVFDWNAAEIGKFHQPKKKPVTMRLDSDVIAWLKRGGRGYQTKANWLLRSAMLRVEAPTRSRPRQVRAQRKKTSGRGTR